jgi:hypothetical protein
MAQQGSGPDLEYSEEGQLEDYLPPLPWDDDLASTQDLFDAIDPLSPGQASKHVHTHSEWQANIQPQISTHSAPQLYSTRSMSTPHIRPYHSGPIALSSQSTGLDALGMFSAGDTRPTLPMGIDPRQPISEVSRLLAISVSKRKLTCESGKVTDARCCPSTRILYNKCASTERAHSVWSRSIPRNQATSSTVEYSQSTISSVIHSSSEETSSVLERGRLVDLRK